MENSSRPVHVQWRVGWRFFPIQKVTESSRNSNRTCSTSIKSIRASIWIGTKLPILTNRSWATPVNNYSVFNDDGYHAYVKSWEFLFPRMRFHVSTASRLKRWYIRITQRHMIWSLWQWQHIFERKLSLCIRSDDWSLNLMIFFREKWSYLKVVCCFDGKQIETDQL